MQFALDPAFVSTYQSKRAPFGFNGLGELVYKRTYARLKLDGSQEEWYETVERVVNGVYRMQQRHIESHRLGWDSDKAQRSAQEMYDRIWNMKFLPPGRGLWAMGSPMTEERGVFAALFNCAACTTGKLATEGAEAFAWLMDASMLGVGVGFDTAGAGTVVVQRPHEPEDLYVIPDTREGWVDSVRRLLNSYLMPQQPRVVFDYSLVRPAGEPIKGFGGIASGPDPLKELHEALRSVLEPGVGSPVTVTHIVDIANLIAKCVVAGNVRRSALLSAGPATDEYLDLKNYEVNPHRATYGWTSNNSVLADVGMDYTEAAERIRINGEPGFLWLENMRKYGRMGELKPDPNVIASNPCVTGETLILTKSGWTPIAGVCGEAVEVWNGFEWSEVTPQVTGFNRPVMLVEFTNGQQLRSTEDHEFVIAGAAKRIKAATLVPGMQLEAHHWPLLSGESVAASPVSIARVSHDGEAAVVYCFTEPLRNLGAFNGVVTGQCGEIPLGDREKCNIVESFPARHESLEDFKRTLKFAYLYCKTVTLSVFEWPDSNRVMLKNRRIGVSQSGVQQFVATHGLNTFKRWCEEGYATLQRYDEVYSDWLAIPRSIRLTTCKPSGTVSLLAGATPGVHWPESKYYVRRMRLSKQSNLLPALHVAQYPIEDAFGSEETTVVVEIPVALDDKVRTLSDVSMWEQVQFGAFMQRYWADNMVSQTVTFDPEREGPQLAAALNYAQYHLKSVSFLPRLEAGAFPQMPYESITAEEYGRRCAALKPLDFGVTAEAAEAERFCSNDTCTF